MTRRLLASIHDVGPRFAAEIEQLAARLEPRLGGPRFALLVVPDHWGEAPLAGDPAFCARLRGWADAGAEIFLHGWYHRDDSNHAGAADRFRARHMTAGEGEFLGLDHATALARMIAGRKLLEDVTGRPLAGFVAPAWLYGPGARQALAEAGFALAEDHMRVWRVADDRVLTRGPVITWASRSRMRRASSIGFAAVGRRALALQPVVRVAVHPGDAHVPALLRSIDRSFDILLRHRRPARYADLIV